MPDNRQVCAYCGEIYGEDYCPGECTCKYSKNPYCQCKKPTSHSMGALPPDFKNILTICNECGLSIKTDRFIKENKIVKIHKFLENELKARYEELYNYFMNYDKTGLKGRERLQELKQKIGGEFAKRDDGI